MFRNLSLVIAILLVLAAPCYGDHSAFGGPSGVISSGDAFGCSSSDAFGTGDCGSYSGSSPGWKYIDAIEKQIKKHWHPEGGEDARPAIVSFSLHRNGQISQVRLKQSSQIRSLDNVALAAVRRSNPLPSVPPGLLNRYLIELTLSTDASGLWSIPSGTPGVTAEIAVPMLEKTTIDWPAYVTRLQKAVGRNWHRDQRHTTAYTSRPFKIFRNGSIANLKVQGESGSKSLTEKSLKLAGPLPPLPKHSPASVLGYLYINDCPNPPRFTEVPQVGKAPSLAAQPDVDFGPYMADLQRQVKAKVTWPPLPGNQTERAVVVFKIHKDGQVSNLRLEKPSGNQALDTVAISAVEQAAPFRHLPEGASDDVDIQYTFDNYADPTKHPKLSMLLSVPYEYFSSSH